MSILVIGSSNVDLTVHCNSIPKPGETILGENFMINFGGKGANQAVAATRLAKNVTFCCKVGNDGYGIVARKQFKLEGINTEYVFTSETEPSGVALICIDNKGENSIVVASGANLKLTPEDIDKIKNIEKYDIILVQLEIPIETVKHIAEIASHNNIRLILNPAPARKLPESILKATSIITPNKTEAEILTGVKIINNFTIKKAAKVLMKKGVEIVIITLGESGSFVCTSEKEEIIPAFKVKAIDTVAAGDIFNGALAVALSEGKDVCESVRFASAASSIAVTRIGAQQSAPYREEVDNKL